MSSTKLHPSLPAPVVHATFSVSQSKSHVLAGVQDAYWSDDEAEDADCPLCLEEMDISDLNFKPCVCGYQICRFCWHHIKENLNKRCPACRRIYTDDAIEFKAIATQDHKRLTQQKKQRDRERKELDALGRRHLSNVRVVQRNVVYVVGIGPRFAKEELIPTLRSNEYFGQYGKITKILLVKRNTPGGGGPVIGLYITYHRREDAARCIAAVDGTASPGGGRDVMRASHGTTKYCMAFLRGVSCSDHSCMNLHEWGDEKDCFTKEDLTTLKHTMKATESRARTVHAKKGDDDANLPRAASWAQRPVLSTSVTVPTTQVNTGSSNATALPSRLPRRGGTTRHLKTNATSTLQEGRTTSASKGLAERKPQLASVSRPATADADSSHLEAVAEDSKAHGLKAIATGQPSGLPALSSAVVLDVADSSPHRHPLAETVPSSIRPPSIIAKVPLVPPGLSAPPGIASTSRPPRVDTASPQTPLLASQSSYQMSNAARALLDDVKARRESSLPVGVGFSPFPDFDRTLQTLSGDAGGGFSFNFDPKLANEMESASDPLADFNAVPNTPFHGTYVEAFPALRSNSPYLQAQSLGHPHSGSRAIFDPLCMHLSSNNLLEKQTKNSGYFGTFNPFADAVTEGHATSSSSPSQRSQPSPIDEERKVSRFGFARGRQNSTTASSPVHATTPLNHDQQFFYNTAEEHAVYSIPHGLHDPSQLHSPSPSLSTQHRPDVLNRELSEAQLRNFIQSRQGKSNSPDTVWSVNDPHTISPRPLQSFEDPAIMSASFASVGTSNHILTPLAYGPPPGLSVPPQGIHPSVVQLNNTLSEERSAFPQVPNTISPISPTLLSSKDFPALVSSEPAPPISGEISRDNGLTETGSKSHERDNRKVAKRAAAAEKAMEKQKLAKEKAEAKAAEKARNVKEKAAEREKAFASKLRQSPEVPPPNTIEPISVVSVGKLPAVMEAAQDKRKPSRDATVDKKKLSVTPIDPIPKASRTNAPKDATSVAAEPAQVPLLSKKPKKNKPIARVSRAPNREDEAHEDVAVPLAAGPSSTPGFTVDTNSSNSRSQSLDRRQLPTAIEKLLEEIDAINPGMELSKHPFFDLRKLNSPAKMPLEYGPLVHALSALSVGGGSFANNMPPGSIDNAVSSFQQLLETLTQTISDLLRLLPRTTWDDSSSFDSVLRDMLKGDDFLDDAGDDGPGKEDEVAALTLALERRARWMEVQLSKLEELHRDINTAAVRAVLSFNDSGWDRHSFLPRIGNTLHRFDNIGLIGQEGKLRPMTADELEKKLVVAKEAAVFAETEIREALERFQNVTFVNDCIPLRPCQGKASRDS